MANEPLPEVIHWYKSTFSATNGECVEFAALPGGDVGVRDSKRPNAGFLTFTRGEIRAFLRGAEAGEFDRFC